MFTNTLSREITTAQKTSAANSINDLKLLFDWLLNLTPADRKKILKMGDKSVAFVRGVLAALKANPAVVPAVFDVSEFEKDLVLYDDMLAILMLLRPLFEGFGDTMMMLGSELMKQANTGFAILQKGAKANSPLSETVKELGARYQRPRRTAPKAFTVQGQQQITLHGVVPLRLVKVLSGGPFSISKGGMPGGGSKLVGINQPLKVPKGWTTITAVNTAKEIGIISLIQN